MTSLAARDVLAVLCHPFGGRWAMLPEVALIVACAYNGTAEAAEPGGTWGPV